MKLYEVAARRGTYAGVNFDDDTVNRLIEYVQYNNLANPVPKDKFHTTLLYSRKHLPHYEPPGKINPAWVGKPTELKVWKSQPPDPTNCLVLLYECDDLIDRHEYLMKEHGATFDYDEYRPHITLSYDIGDMDVKQLSPIDEIGDITIVREYGEELNTDWAKDNT